MNKPTKPCYVCGANDWRETPGGGWCCNGCRPGLVSEEASALLERVRKGNDKLFAAWLQIRDILDKEEKERQFLRWDAAKETLNLLRLELQSKGYNDCLYLENGKKTKRCLDEPGEWFCNTCPSTREYWVEEMKFKGG